jgi:hypothetical protein
VVEEYKGEFYHFAFYLYDVIDDEVDYGGIVDCFDGIERSFIDLFVCGVIVWTVLESLLKRENGH